MDKDTALNLTKEFLQAQLVLRNLEAAARPLAEDIFWFGTGLDEVVRNRADALIYLRRELQTDPHPYTLHYLWEESRLLSPDTGVCMLQTEITAQGLCLPCRVTATVGMREGVPKLCTLHMSAPDSAQQQGEFFPFSLAKAHEKELYQDFLNTRVSGGILGGYLEPGWPLYMVNRQLLDFLGYASEEQLRDALSGLVLNGIHPDDRKMVVREVEAQLAEKDTYQVSYRMLCQDGRFIWVEDRGKRIITEGDRPAVISICYDISEQKQAQQALFSAQRTTDIALENADIFIWEYRIPTATTLQRGRHMTRFGIPPVLEHMPQSAVDMGLIHPDSIDEYLRLYREAAAGMPSVQADVQMVDLAGLSIWYHMTFKTMFDDDGTPVSAIGCAVDITSMKNLQIRYQAEMAYLAAAQGTNLLGKCRANLSLDILDNYSGTEALQISHNTQVYSVFVKALAALCPGDREQTRVRHALSPASLLKLYSNGIRDHSLEYRRQLPSGAYCWVQTMIKLSADPDTGSVFCFLYSYNIDRHKIAEAALHAMVQKGYDFVGVANRATDAFTCIARGTHAFQDGSFYGSYEKDVRSFAENLRSYFSSEADYLLLRDGVSFDCLAKELTGRQEYGFNFKLWNKERKVLHTYHMSYCYIDAEQTQILVCRTDITQTVAEEQRRQDILITALRQAEEASHAKTDFLSKMSHEIRTPMNAIIGMNALAAQNIGDPAQAGDCIAKVGISARYLLSLINDILDMSRIESGKVNLRKEKIPFQEFLASVNTICYEQATERGVSYDAIITSFVEDTYLGDAMKLQQILVNLLSNAVKFTAPGGKVQLIVSQESVENGTAQMRFTVNDTGVGISEEFQKVMFDPFEQEHSGITTPYGGTGLGLAITKNLVALMGGQIHVNSIIGVGSEFVVTLPLEVGESSPSSKQSLRNLHLEKLTALVVDDEVLICEQTKSILSDIGRRPNGWTADKRPWPWYTAGGRRAADLTSSWWTGKCRT